MGTRTALAGVGHYHCHRAKDGIRDWAEVLFDIQYVGASVVLSDGHVMLHHIYTETPADVKRTVFNYMLTLPRIVRVPIFTLQKFTEFFSGHLLRYFVAVQHLEERNSKLKDFQFKLLRCYMVAEMFWAVYCGQTWMWCLQFFCTAPAQLPAIPKPVLVGGTGFKGFVTEHLQPTVLAKATWNIVLGFTGATI